MYASNRGYQQHHLFQHVNALCEVAVECADICLHPRDCNMAPPGALNSLLSVNLVLLPGCMCLAPGLPTKFCDERWVCANSMQRH